MLLRPGQLHLNEFELALLERIALQNPFGTLADLHVLSREFTGVGSFTKFKIPDLNDGMAKSQLRLPELINMPTVENGLGAILFCRDGKPECLEVYTFGAERWDGVFEGFTFSRPSFHYNEWAE